MSKIGVITIQNIVNYGNRLQNFAVHRLITKRGHECESIRISDNVLWGKIYAKTLLGVLFKLSFSAESKRTCNFLKFNKNFLKIKAIGKSRVKKYVPKNYDYLVLGGDQLWAVGNLDYGIPGYRFGSLLYGNKRIAFGVSFGGGKIDETYGRYIKPYLEDIGALSVRESSGAKIIYDLTGRESEVLLDPVFALTREEWDELANKGDDTGDEKYALTFFLGGSSNEMDGAIAAVTNTMGIEKIMHMEKKEDESFKAGPIEFIRYVRNADIIFTDSFHCVAFSIIYHKPFVAFKRLNWMPEQMDRIENLLKVLGIEDRVYTENSNTDYTKINYDFCDSQLKIERKRISNYLDRYLGKVVSV